MTVGERQVAAVVAAAGSGTRLGGRSDGPKALLEVGGRSLLDLAVANLLTAGVDSMVVVYTPGHRGAFAEITRRHGPIVLVEGGPTRSQSVRAGVAALEHGVHLVAIHDAARPLTPPRIIRRVLAAVRDDVVAAAPGLAVPDTLKRADAAGRVVRTLDRSGVWAAHTPQVVRADVLDATLDWAGDREASDDLGLVEMARAGGAVAGEILLVPGDPRDLKITYPADLDLAAALVSSGWTERV